MSARPIIGTHFSNDDRRLYEFARTSGLPHGYFKRDGLSPDAWVVIVTLALGAFVAVGVAWGWI